MANVVQQDGQVEPPRLFGIDGDALRAKDLDGLSHQVHGTQRMLEPGVLG